jgi:hypothetical protein
MSHSRRLTALETSLSPTQLVVRWLAEARSFGDVESWARSLVTDPPPPSATARMVGDADAGARTAMRGNRPEIVNAAARSAVRETLFRWELVAAINRQACQLLDHEGLALAAFTGLALLTARFGATDPLAETYAGSVVTCRDALARRVDELHAWAKAWSIAAERYLAGHGALFPDIAAAFDRLVEEAEALTDTVVRLGELDGVPAPKPPDPDALSVRTAQLVADLVEPAKSAALEQLGERAWARDIAVAWMRTQLEPSGATRADEASTEKGS